MTLVLVVLLVLAAGVVGAKCWPEQLLILGGLGFLGFGPDLGWLFLLFPVVWIGVRIGQAGSRLMIWLQPVEEGSGSGIRQPGPAAGS